jgi:hypothetical protein
MKIPLSTSLIYFSGILTASTAAISQLTGFWAGWFLLISVLLSTTISYYFEQKQGSEFSSVIKSLVSDTTRMQRYDQQYIQELETTVEEQGNQVWELTEAAITDEGCTYCESKHSLLSFYPFDPALHMRGCPIPYMRSQVDEIKLCDPAKIEEYSARER